MYSFATYKEQYKANLRLALPVMQQWSYPGLKIAPGRYSGSLYTDDLVIAGHNYARHFGPLAQLTVGTEVLFVDMNDNTHGTMRYRTQRSCSRPKSRRWRSKRPKTTGT